MGAITRPILISLVICIFIAGLHLSISKANNECKPEKSICGFNSVCTNTEVSFRCNCFVGFESKTNDGKNCSDTDECNKAKRCGSIAVCENTVGSFHCSCPNGFSFDAEEKKCYDIDECAVNDLCGLNMVCVNTVGSHYCDCRQGYRPETEQSCIEIDECDEGNYSCPKFSGCKNNDGGYDCPCFDGFEKTAQGTCAGTCVPKCDEKSYCENGECLCREGFTLGLDLKCQPNKRLLAGSGMSLQSPAILLTAALLWCLALI